MRQPWCCSSPSFLHPFLCNSDLAFLRNRRTATDGESKTTSSQGTLTSRSNDGRAESASHGHGDASIPRAIVTNAVPFRLEDGLPRELGPLLFDANADGAVLAGKNDLISSPETDASNLNLNEQKDEEEHGLENGRGKQNWINLNEQREDAGWYGLRKERGKDIWTRKPDPLGTGEVFSHVREWLDGGGACVEVRLRAGPLGAAELAKAGLPKDVSALVVGVDGGDTINRKGVGGGGAGVSASAGKTGTSRAHQ